MSSAKREAATPNTAQEDEYNRSLRQRAEAPDMQHEASEYSRSLMAQIDIFENGSHLSYRALETKSIDFESSPTPWRQREGALF